VGFEPIISAGEPPQTHALDRAATGTGVGTLGCVNIEGRDGLDALKTRTDGDVFILVTKSE